MIFLNNEGEVDFVTVMIHKAMKGPFIEKEPPQQPDRCKGCVWGKWDGIKQFCPKPVCVRVTPEGMTIKKRRGSDHER